MDVLKLYQPTLLIACQDTEFAFEEEDETGSFHGKFTSAIMNTLRSNGRELTCRKLIELIGPLSPHQVPRFDGKDPDRLFFQKVREAL